jgi:hypothetical protein
MIRRAILVVLLSSFLFAHIEVQVHAQPRTVGLSVGNWFVYGSIEVAWNSNDTDVVAPVFLKVLNETERELIMIEGISNTLVTARTTDHYINGTEKTYGGSIDVNIGTGNMTLMVISANLGPDDPVYTFGSYSTWKINETTTGTYPDGDRQVNHLNITDQRSTGSSYFYGSANYYWDRLTGMLVETSGMLMNRTGVYYTSWSMHFRITESSIWVVTEFPSLLILPLFIGTTLWTAILYRRRRLEDRTGEISNP